MMLGSAEDYLSSSSFSFRRRSVNRGLMGVGSANPDSGYQVRCIDLLRMSPHALCIDNHTNLSCSRRHYVSNPPDSASLLISIWHGFNWPITQSHSHAYESAWLTSTAAILTFHSHKMQLPSYKDCSMSPTPGHPIGYPSLHHNQCSLTPSHH